MLLLLYQIIRYEILEAGNPWFRAHSCPFLTCISYANTVTPGKDKTALSASE